MVSMRCVKQGNSIVKRSQEEDEDELCVYLTNILHYVHTILMTTVLVTHIKSENGRVRGGGGFRCQAMAMTMTKGVYG
jgi:hypothetical protein